MNPFQINLKPFWHDHHQSRVLECQRTMPTTPLPSKALNAHVTIPFAIMMLICLYTLGYTKPNSQSNTTNHPKGPRPDAWIETISWNPRASVFHGLITDQEADQLVALAEPRLQRSSVVNHDGSVDKSHDIRTSYGMFLHFAETDLVADIDRRVATWSHLPAVHSENIQILRYGINQTYGGHYDELDPTEDLSAVVGGEKESPRLATVLIYLTDTESGGETAFPDGQWIDANAQAKGVDFSSCTKGGPAVKPKKGDALLFWGLTIDLKHLDPYSLHTGCPVVQGVKYVAVKWIHARPYRAYLAERKEAAKEAGVWEVVQGDEGDGDKNELACVDKRPKECPGWVARGECDKNPVFMLGWKPSAGNCLKSCGVCCDDANDTECVKTMMEKRKKAKLD